jgi:hypothetical protein
MYYEPCARVTISTANGSLIFDSVNKIEIDESVKELGNKATVTVPRNYKEINGVSILSLLKSGATVDIELGNDGQYFPEFSGYLDEIESDAPLVLHIDDKFYPWKRNNLRKTLTNATLKDILHFAFPTLTIDCPAVKVGTFPIGNVSSYQVLLKLNEELGFYSRLHDKTLSCLWPFKISTGMSGIMHTYEFYTPTIKKNSLKYHRREDVKVRVRITSTDRAGKKIKYEVGAKEGEGSLYTMNLPNGLSMAQLKEYGDSWYNKLSFNGYSGNITGFGTPRTHAGDTLKIVDSQEPDREGNFLIDSVKIIYDLTQGFERENNLSFKV